MMASADLTVYTRVEFKGAEVLRDISMFLQVLLDAAGPYDGTQEAAALVARLDAAVADGDVLVTASVDKIDYQPLSVNAPKAAESEA